ncbi:MAG: alpha-glucan family phosphorylase [Verrucomicrobia bacterium]|nr:alpha-glucan family phosphorylase [Verrucomicrobiota bacterium]
MEIALEPGIPTYSGGLGILAGDTIRAAADRDVPMVAVSLLHRKGYFYQRLDSSGWQTEEPAEWVVEDFLAEQPQRVVVNIEGRAVHVRAWQYDVTGAGGGIVPVYLLDTDLPENTEWDRALTHYLYGGDNHYRLCQEAILGLGGVRLLRALGLDSIQRFHMNEGHASLLTVELLLEEARKAQHPVITPDDIEAVRKQCIFTTHTPVPAGHDQFPMDMVRRVLGLPDVFAKMQDQFCVNFAAHVLNRPPGAHDMKALFCTDTMLNMTYLALNLSHYVNGVAKKHAEVSRHMFAEYRVDAITNGVHVPTWTSRPFQELFDRHIPGWREDSFSLRYALGIPPAQVWAAHETAKRDLVEWINHETNAGFDRHDFTIGFARRAATYKRADLLFHNLDRLRAIVAKAGRLQIVYAGKAHPQDQNGKELIKHIVAARDALRHDIKIAYLPNYDWDLGCRLTAGVDVWLNTPLPPMEASGTSGMKAALNGVPSLSILDGWWIEGCIEGVTGWAIDSTAPAGGDRTPHDAASLYDKLENVVLPLFYRDRDRFLDVMRHAIALNGSFFNTQRMILQYVLKAYFV